MATKWMFLFYDMHLRLDSPRLRYIGLILLIILGLLAVDGFGVSADEPAMLTFGEDTFAYLFQGGPLPRAIDWGFHSPVVQLAFVIIQKMLGVTDGREIWLLRHFLTFLIFVGGVSAFVAIAKRRFGPGLALLGVVFLILSPRVFAHGFYNPKDIPTMALFTTTMLTMLRFIERPTIGRLVMHALMTAILISLRTAGVLMVMFTIILLLLPHSPFVSAQDRLRGAAKEKNLDADTLCIAVVRIISYFIMFALLMVLLWPRLWSNPIGNFLYALTNSAGRGGGGFYFGETIVGTPWHYPLVWIGITTPILYSVLFLIGLGACIIRVTKEVSSRATPHLLKKSAEIDLLSMLWLFLPLLSIPLFGVGIFDEWRHLLFLYPAFLLIGLVGLESLLKACHPNSDGTLYTAKNAPRFALCHGERSRTTNHAHFCKIVIIGVILLSCFSTAFWMVRHHPYHYAYFNRLARPFAENFERDYWGLSYREGLEWILRNDNRSAIKVYGSARVIRANADLLPLPQWNRLAFVAPADADYLLDNFRANEYREVLPPEREVHAITVDGLKLLSIYRGPDTDGTFESYNW